MPITDEVIEQINRNAEAGYPGVTVHPVGRPVEIGATRAVPIQFRLDPERARRLDERARAEHKTRSQFIRDAIDRELASA